MLHDKKPVIEDCCGIQRHCCMTQQASGRIALPALSRAKIFFGGIAVREDREVEDCYEGAMSAIASLGP